MHHWKSHCKMQTLLSNKGIHKSVIDLSSLSSQFIFLHQFLAPVSYTSNSLALHRSCHLVVKKNTYSTW